MTSVPHSGATSVTPGGSVAGGHTRSARFEGATYSPSAMTRDERSFLLYAETCAVDYGGLLEGARMNREDHEAAARMVNTGLIRYGRMPARLLNSPYGKTRTHYVELTEAGWVLATLLRRERADRRGPLATEVFASVNPAIAKATAGETRNAEPIHRRDGDEG